MGTKTGSTKLHLLTGFSPSQSLFFLFVTETSSHVFSSIFAYFSLAVFLSSIVISGVFYTKKSQLIRKESLCFSPASAVAVHRFNLQKVP